MGLGNPVKRGGRRDCFASAVCTGLVRFCGGIRETGGGHVKAESGFTLDGLGKLI